MKVLRRLLKRFEDDMAAAAFAEAGEFRTAREILKNDYGSEEVSHGEGAFDEGAPGLNILIKQAESK